MLCVEPTSSFCVKHSLDKSEALNFACKCYRYAMSPAGDKIGPFEGASMRLQAQAVETNLPSCTHRHHCDRLKGRTSLVVSNIAN